MKKALPILLIVGCLLSCNTKSQQTPKQTPERTYTVRLSNWVGSDYYRCDSIIWVSESHFKLKNKEEREPFMDIIIPEGVVVRISPNNL